MMHGQKNIKNIYICMYVYMCVCVCVCVCVCMCVCFTVQLKYEIQHTGTWPAAARQGLFYNPALFSRQFSYH